MLSNIVISSEYNAINTTSSLNQSAQFALQAACLAVCIALPKHWAKGDFMKSKWVMAAFFGAAMTVAGAAQAEDLVFTLKNGTSSVLNAFYTSPVGVNDWEDDVFGKKALGPGEEMEITIADGRSVCKYDMRFEFQGDALEDLEDTQNLCELGEYTITE